MPRKIEGIAEIDIKKKVDKEMEKVIAEGKAIHNFSKTYLVKFTTSYEFEYLTNKIFHSVAPAKATGFPLYCFIKNEEILEKYKEIYTKYIEDIEVVRYKDLESTNGYYDEYVENNENVCNLSDVNARHKIYYEIIGENNEITKLAKELPYKIFLELVKVSMEEIEEERRLEKEKALTK